MFDLRFEYNTSMSNSLWGLNSKILILNKLMTIISYQIILQHYHVEAKIVGGIISMWFMHHW